MIPQEIRNLRLKNDYHQMVNIKGDTIEWQAIGTPPYIEEYHIVVRVKGIIGDAPKYRDFHHCKVILPYNYPMVAPRITMISEPRIYHPNWYESGLWDWGSWNEAEGLGEHIVRMVKTIQYELKYVNEHSPSNRDANKWYITNKSSGFFPCDNKVLPDPTKKKMTINSPVKKKFDIK